MKNFEVLEIEKPTQEKRIFDLECQVSMLTEFVVQLTDELKGLGIGVSDKLKEESK